MAGKIVILAGNKRAGKTTLSTILNKKYSYNYYNFDMLLDSLEIAFPVLKDKNDDKYVSFLDEMIERSLDDTKNYDVNFVYEYIFTPKQLSQLKHRNDVEIYFLANLDANQNNIREDFKKYSKPFDWPSYVPEKDIERNVKEILKMNEMLKEDCKKYNFELINTGRAEKRNQVINDLINKITND